MLCGPLPPGVRKPILPPDIVVRESRRLSILMAVFCASLGLLLAYTGFERFSAATPLSDRIIHLSFVGLFLLGSAAFVKAARRRKVVLAASREGLFFPLLSPNLIPWRHVEKVQTTRLGPGKGIRIFLSDDFLVTLNLPRSVRGLVKAGSAVGMRGWILRGFFNHSPAAISHAVDAWIRFDRGEAPKPRYRPGIVERLVEKLGGRE
jgi:hypothetical protein